MTLLQGLATSFSSAPDKALCAHSTEAQHPGPYHHQGVFRCASPTNITRVCTPNSPSSLTSGGSTTNLLRWDTMTGRSPTSPTPTPVWDGPVCLANTPLNRGSVEHLYNLLEGSMLPALDLVRRKKGVAWIGMGI